MNASTDIEWDAAGMFRPQGLRLQPDPIERDSDRVQADDQFCMSSSPKGDGGVAL